jgi:hypothetical protein
MNRDWAALPRLACRLRFVMGEACHFVYQVFLYITFLIAMLCSQKCFAGRYLCDIE